MQKEFCKHSLHASKKIKNKKATCYIRAFSSIIVKILAFTISKYYFYNFNTSFYNIPNIKHSIFFTTLFKYSFFNIFIHFFFNYFSLTLCLSPTVSPSFSTHGTTHTQASHCQPPPQPSLIPIPTTTNINFYSHPHLFHNQ